MKLLQTGPIIRFTHGEIKRHHPFRLLRPRRLPGKMCAGASQQCEITPQGGQRKGSQPKSVTWIPLNVPHLSGALHSAWQESGFISNKALENCCYVFFFSLSLLVMFELCTTMLLTAELNLLQLVRFNIRVQYSIPVDAQT